MDDPQPTRFSLLVRLRNAGDGRAWGEFVEIYTPVVYGFARKRGLQDADVSDVTQDVFRTVFRSISKFQCSREKGSFRAWLKAEKRAVSGKQLTPFLLSFIAERIGRAAIKANRALAINNARLAAEVWGYDLPP